MYIVSTYNYVYVYMRTYFVVVENLFATFKYTSTYHTGPYVQYV